MSSTGHDPTSSRAPEKELAALHGALAKHMADMLKSKEPVPPATLNAIRQFLITKALPTFEGDGEDVEERLLH